MIQFSMNKYEKKANLATKYNKRLSTQKSNAN